MLMDLTKAREGEEYIVKDIITEDEELNAFLFSLGCYSGEPITVIAHRRGGCVVSIKDGRYNIDTDLAQAIAIQDCGRGESLIGDSFFQTTGQLKLILNKEEREL